MASTRPPPPNAKRPKYIGNYEVKRVIGEGSFGKVKLGVHVLTGEKVAIKVLNRAQIEGTAEQVRLRREIGLLKLLRHPNIVRLYEVIDIGDKTYLIMEYAEGGEVFDYIVALGRVNPREARKFFRQILSAVAYCHANSVIHRDLKPENLLLDSAKNIKIIDFGFSNTMAAGKLMSTFCGSPAYAAPEMVAGKAYEGTQVDIWAMGVILYALICGYLPFDDDDIGKLYEKIVVGEYEVPSWMGDDVHDLVASMLVLDPDRRATLEEIAEHRWLNKGYDAPVEFAEARVAAPAVEAILDEMEGFEFGKDEVRVAVESGEQNQMTATYYLLLDKYERDGTLKDLKTDAQRMGPVVAAAAAAATSPVSRPPTGRKSTRPRVSSPLASGSGAGVREEGAVEGGGEGGEPILPQSSDRSGGGDGSKPVLSIADRIRSNEKRRRHSMAPAPLDLGRRSLPSMAAETITEEEEESDVPASTSTASPGPARRRSGSRGKAKAKAKGKAKGKGKHKGKHKGKGRTVATAADRVKASGRSGRKFSLDAAAAALASAFSRGEKRSSSGGSGLRTVKGVFSVSTTSNKDPDEILDEIHRVLAENEVDFEPTGTSPYYLECADTGTLRFEVEICRIPNMTLHGLRLKRVHGDTWEYKRLCHKLVGEMRL